MTDLFLELSEEIWYFILLTFGILRNVIETLLVFATAVQFDNDTSHYHTNIIKGKVCEYVCLSLHECECFPVCEWVCVL